MADAGIDRLNIQFLENVGNDEVRGSHASILRCRARELDGKGCGSSVLIGYRRAHFCARLEDVEGAYVASPLGVKLHLVRFTLR
jgi:hypothetical protein